jgi:hypothetical protein
MDMSTKSITVIIYHHHKFLGLTERASILILNARLE